MRTSKLFMLFANVNAYVFCTIMATCFFTNISISQSSSQNYIKKTIPVYPVTNEATLGALPSSYKVESISYLDGLGRTLQDVLVKASPNYNDVVQPYSYDKYGRQPIQLLPYVDATLSGTYRSLAFGSQPLFYANQTMVAKSSSPYSETVFDGSPLNQVIETSAPDTDWKLGNGHTTKSIISTNNDYEVLMFYKTPTGDFQTDPLYDHYYGGNTLTATKIIDANGNYSIIYTDKQGKTVCTKQFSETLYAGPGSTLPYPSYLTTYLIYDDFGKLILVIPPKAIEIMVSNNNYSVNALTQDLVFKYVYDERHRLIEKKVPGTDWTYIVYNQLNQPVLFQDANLKSQNKWSFVKYDILGRPIMSGLFEYYGHNAFGTRAGAQALFNSPQLVIGESEILEDASNPFGYTNLALPNQNLEILTVNYYDDYDFNNDGESDYVFNSSSIPCIYFSTPLLQGININMQECVNTVDGIDISINTSISQVVDNTALLEKLNECLLINKQLKTISTSNFSLSQSLLQVEDQVVISNLNTSLKEQTSIKLIRLKTALDSCILLGQNGSADLIYSLAEIDTLTNVYSQKVSSGLSLLTTVIGGCKPYTNTATNRTRGYLTGSLIKVLDFSNPVQWEASVVFYDNDGQAIQSQSNDHLGGTDLINMVYDFAGNTVHTSQLHVSPSQPNITILNHMNYDKMGRLKSVEQQNNNDIPVVLSSYKYNELSQVIDKKVHSINYTSFIQSIDYRYNIHGHLSSINNIDLSSDMTTNPLNGTNDDSDDLWGMQLNYNTNTAGVNGSKQYTGNVAEKKWRSVTDNIKRAYGYNYDNIDRIKSSSYVEYDATSSTWNNNIGKFDEKNITYDANGNILSLQRNGFQVASSTFGLIDNLSYQYNGNFLGSVTDAITTHGLLDFKDNGSVISNEYTYDSNGNKTSDPNKGITNIIYNHLNLPIQITFGSNKIEYKYDAIGTRLSKKVTQGATVTTKNYCGLFEYNSSMLIESIHTSEGRCVTSGVTSPQFIYEYQYTDNTGNVVMAFSDSDYDGVINPTSEVIQQSHYYSFGMRMEGTNVVQIGVENKYKFGGKELDDELGLNELDFGARFYDPAIARWGNIDPMADAAPNWTPFRYGFNNPVTVTDPTGMLESGVIDSDREEWENQRGSNGPEFSVNNIVEQYDGDPKKKTGIDGRGKSYVVSGGSNSLPPPSIMPSIQITSIGGSAGVPDLRPTISQGSEARNEANRAETARSTYGGDGSGSFSDKTMYVLDKVRDFSPLTMANDALSTWMFGTDSRGISQSNIDGAYAAFGAIPFASIERAIAKPFMVGSYRELTMLAKGSGLDAHHVGQQALMKKFIPDYNFMNAPAILVPKLGHTLGSGVVSRSTRGFVNARQVVARDVLELRRVYAIPNSQLLNLIQMNKKMYPKAFMK